MRLRKIINASAIVVFVTLLMTPVAYMQGAISQEVLLNDEVAEGSLVSLTDGDPKKVTLADTGNGDYLFGIVTTNGKSLAELGGVEDGLPVVTSGTASVIVTTINGDISKGDVLGVSKVSGAAARASTSQGATTIGVALDDFNSSSPTAKQVTTTENSGKTNQVTIGTVSVKLAINSFYLENVAESNILLTAGERFVGRPVSQAQTIGAAAIVFASIVVGGMMMWHAVRGGFISIGRNPLAGGAVFNGLFYVTLMSIAVIVGGFVAGYIVLLL